MVTGEQIRKRLFSLSGVVPLAFFLLEHTWANASALRGQDAYVSTETALARVPLLIVVEIALVFVPLGYHAIYGAWMVRAPLEEGAKPYGRRLAIANRVAAMIALVFIAWHFWEMRIQTWRSGVDPQSFYATLAWHMSSTWHGFPVRAVLYLIGVTATVAHFACSGWGYGVTAGYFATRRQKKRAAYGFLAFGSILFLASASTVVSLATGMHFTSPPQSSAPCTPEKK